MKRDNRAAFDILAGALARCHADRISGALRIVGNPGGLFHLRGGAVVAVDSPGSPGAETLLVSSGRISAASWTEALVDSVATRSLAAALRARGTLGSAAIEVLAMAVIRDGAFATAAGEVERYLLDGDSAEVLLLTAAEGVPPELLLPDTARRLDALASLPFPLSPHRERVVPGDGAAARPLTAAQRAILEHATGRRTARDLAFALGRGLYPVTVQVSRMLGEQLLAIAPPAASFSFSHRDLTSLRIRAETGAPPTGKSLPIRSAKQTAPDS